MMKKNKTPIIIISSIILALLLITCSFIIIHNYNKSKYQEAQERFVVVKQVNKDSIIVEDSVSRETKTYLTDGESYNEGDLVSITTKGDKVEDHKVIVENYNKMTTQPVVVVDDTTTTTITNNVITTTTSTSKANVVKTTTVKSTTVVKTTTTTKVSTKDETVLRQVENDYKTIKNSSDTSATFKENAKKKFIEIVDFIYYDGKIKGVTFKELKNTTKGKIIYYALLLDAAIDSKFPNYKDNISDKYKDIKSKLLAEYLEVKYEVCLKSTDDCEQFNADFQLLKTSLKLTWDFIKGCFMYVKNLTVPKIKSWYESFRG